ncbi:hypothetical protein [Bifidobacterium parmae]|uniref:Uncharacterized protein n=1 Tax=Bifidobacterium parmae TaxID=361854 RepID=A0A2N5IVN1_9BIFI|nr:hypothetical protein [Bifidobacterium parmae]PLS26025.1 hypothetical protein Uis4E_2200 [Bifidobacterium parmae]
MGGRGSSSGVGANGAPYGTEYLTLFQVDNIKFVERRDGKPVKAPIETMSKNRIYATIEPKSGQINSISIMENGKVRSQIDYRDHGPFHEHVHDWDYSGDKPRRGAARPLTDSERRLFDKINGEYRRFRR